MVMLKISAMMGGNEWAMKAAQIRNKPKSTQKYLSKWYTYNVEEQQGAADQRDGNDKTRNIDARLVQHFRYNLLRLGDAAFCNSNGR